MRVQRHTRGSVRFDRRRKTWNYLFYDSGKRRSKLIGTRQQYPTKAAAWKAVERLPTRTTEEPTGDTVRSVIARYEMDRMPSRKSTSRVYRSFLKNHIAPDRPGTALMTRAIAETVICRSPTTIAAWAAPGTI